MNFIQKLDNTLEHKEIENNIQLGGKNDLNGNTISLNIQPNIQANEQAINTQDVVQQIDLVNDNSQENNNTEQLHAPDEHIINFKKHIQLLDDNHHYFINYNNCYSRTTNILKIKKQNSIQEITNNIKMTFSKYKNKKYNITFNLNNISITDSSNNKEITNVEIPFIIDLKRLLNIEEKKTLHAYQSLKLDYQFIKNNSLLTDAEKNLYNSRREKIINKLNDFYIVQYLYYKNINIKPNDNHYTIHNFTPKFNFLQDKYETKLELYNNSINNETLDAILTVESNSLDTYNNILSILNSNNTKENDTELKDMIKQYIKDKKSFEKKIKSISEKKYNKSLNHTYLYITKEQLKNLNFKPFSKYIRNNYYFKDNNTLLNNINNNLNNS